MGGRGEAEWGKHLTTDIVHREEVNILHEDKSIIELVHTPEIVDYICGPKVFIYS